MTNRDDYTILEIERSLLATLMLRPADCFRVTLLPEYFASEQHADIYTGIRARVTDAKPFDPVSMLDYFEQLGRKPIGQLALEIGNESLVTAVPEAFAFRVTQAWRQREARAIGMALVESKSPDAVDVAISALMNLHAVEQNHEWDAKQATTAAFTELTTVYESGGKLPGVTTGLKDIDEKLGGLHRGDMIVVGGRAAMGKTAFVIGMASAAAAAGVPVGVISGEQPVEQVALRMLSAKSRLEAKKFRSADFAEEEWPRIYNAVADTATLPMWFLDRSAPTMAEVVRVARRWKHKHGIQALYVDYLQRIVGVGERKFEQVGYVARGLKNLARDLDIPVVVLAQVSRAVEGRASQVPRMGDLSDSSEIEKEADQIMMLFREGYYDKDANQNVARVVFEKNRHGPTGYVDVSWQGGIMAFGDLASGYDDVFGDAP